MLPNESNLSRKDEERRQFMAVLRERILKEKDWPRKPDRNFRMNELPPPGWLLPTLIECESACWGRWDHWAGLAGGKNAGEEIIPRIEFDPDRNNPARRMHENALDSISGAGWRGWGSWENFNYYLDWLLYAFGHQGQKEAPSEPESGAFARLYQTFCLEAMLAWPADILGDLLADNAHGRARGFYPTPHSVSEMMARMLMDGEDCRMKTVCDPCLGTGRLLLHASNYSYRLYGQDIDSTVIRVALVNGYCFAPWLVRPLFEDSRQSSATMSDAMTTQANTPQSQEYLNNTEHDTDQQYRFEPIKKRRRKDEPEIAQGLLFGHLKERGH